MNIEAYDGTTDPGVWIEDFVLHIHMARGDDLHAIKYLPVKLKGPALSRKMIHEHLWDRQTESLSVRRGAEIARRADRGEAHEQFTQLRSSPER